MKVMTMLGLIAVALIVSGCTEKGTASNGGKIVTTEHDGHLFTVWDGFRAGGIIHSPSCPCHTNNRKELQ